MAKAVFLSEGYERAVFSCYNKDTFYVKNKRKNFYGKEDLF